MRVALCIILLLVAVSSQDGEIYHIRGNNFQGEVSLSSDSLRLSIVEYAKGEIYHSQISSESLSKEFKRYLIFQDLSQLYSEITSNKEIQISYQEGQDSLLLPIEVTYKSKQYRLSIAIPLSRKTFSCEAEKIESLFNLIKQMNEEKENAQRYLPQQIHFKGDHSNEKYRMFELTDSRRVKMLDDGQYLIFNHLAPVPKKGVYYFKLRVVNSHDNFIFVGICGKEVRAVPNAYLDPGFMGLYLANGNLYGNGRNSVGASGLSIEAGSILRVQIDTNKKVVAWYLNDSIIHLSPIWKSLASQQFYPMVALYSLGDTVQFMNK